jgi:hypothetical protein
MPQLEEREKAIIEDLNWAREHSTELHQRFQDVWIAIVNKQVVARGTSITKVKKEAARKTGKRPDEIAIKFIEGGLTIYGTHTAAV